MLTHLVLLKPRPQLPAPLRRAFIEAFARALHEIPTVRGFRIGTRITHGASYETGAPDSADFMAAIDFDDLAGLHAYLVHPAHDELGRLFGDASEARMIYDFETGGSEMLEGFRTP